LTGKASASSTLMIFALRHFFTSACIQVSSRSLTCTKARGQSSQSTIRSTFSDSLSVVRLTPGLHPDPLDVSPLRHQIERRRRRQFADSIRRGQISRVVYAATNSILILRPSARAALPSVFRVTDELDPSSRRSTAARLVFMRAAISALVSAFCFNKRPNWRLTACFNARASTSSRQPSSFRKSRKSLPRCVLFFIGFLDIAFYVSSPNQVQPAAPAAAS
jgi:hypothetical protein